MDDLRKDILGAIVGTYDCQPNELCNAVANDVAVIGSKLCLTITKFGHEKFTEDELHTIMCTISGFKDVVKLLSNGYEAMTRDEPDRFADADDSE